MWPGCGNGCQCCFQGLSCLVGSHTWGECFFTKHSEVNFWLRFCRLELVSCWRLPTELMLALTSWLLQRAETRCRFWTFFWKSGAIQCNQTRLATNCASRADNVYLRENRWTWLRRWTSRGLPSTSGSSLRFSGFTQFFPAPCFCLQACFFPLYIPGLAAPPGDKQCNAWGRSDQLQFKASCKF